MGESRAMRALESLEMTLYRNADAMVTVTETFRRELIERGIDAAKIHTVINGVDQGRYFPQPKPADLLRALDLEGRFVVGYIGTQGLAHALHLVLEAADLLRGRPEIAFLFVGSGADHQALVGQAQALGLPNVRFVERQPKAEMPRYWALCDLALVHLKDDPLFASVIPSKIFEAMGMGLPLLLVQPEGEAADLVRGAGAGLWIEPGSAAGLAAACEGLCDDPPRREALAQASAAAAAGWSRDRQAAAMLDVLTGLVERPAP
jgi:glycosyltransferase involved in cell wall biosynthesis